MCQIYDYFYQFFFGDSFLRSCGSCSMHGLLPSSCAKLHCEPTRWCEENQRSLPSNLTYWLHMTPRMPVTTRITTCLVPLASWVGGKSNLLLVSVGLEASGLVILFIWAWLCWFEQLLYGWGSFFGSWAMWMFRQFPWELAKAQAWACLRSGNFFRDASKMSWWGPFCSASLFEAGLAGNVGIDCARWIRVSYLKVWGVFLAMSCGIYMDLPHFVSFFPVSQMENWCLGLVVCPPSNPKPRRLHLSDLHVAGFPSGPL